MFTHRVRGQSTSSASPSYEQQARTPSSSISTRTESHFDSFHSPPSEVPNTIQTPFVGSIARSRSASGTSSTTAKRPLHMISDTFQSINPTKRLHRQQEEYDQHPESQVQISVTSIPNTVPAEARAGPLQHAVESIDPLVLEWRNDPYRTRPHLVMRNMDLYFTHVNSATYQMFSRELFLDWIRDEQRKSLDELMVVYCMLAMASMFSNQDIGRSEGSVFARIARYAVDQNHGKFNLQLAQSRLLLALYHFSLGDAARAWDYCGSALSVVAGLQMTSEQGILKNAADKPLDFGLNHYALEECYRRTSWSAFLMDVSIPRSHERAVTNLIARYSSLFRTRLLYSEGRCFPSSSLRRRLLRKATEDGHASG